MKFWRPKHIWIVLLSLATLACRSGADGDQEILAQVQDHSFTRSDLLERMPRQFSDADSARIAEQIINAWVRDMAILSTAEAQLSPDQLDVQKQLEDYRKSLLTYAYEHAYIAQKLDTSISDSELRSYYETHTEQLRLKRNIVKVRFVKLAIDAPKQKEVVKWLQSDDEDDVDALYDYSRKYAENFYFDSDRWLFLEDLLKEVPLPGQNLEEIIKSQKKYQFDDGDFRYFLYLADYRLKGDVSPFGLERGRIRNLLINKRKVELIGKMREDIVSKGIADGTIKMHSSP